LFAVTQAIEVYPGPPRSCTPGRDLRRVSPRPDEEHDVLEGTGCDGRGGVGAHPSSRRWQMKMALWQGDDHTQNVDLMVILGFVLAGILVFALMAGIAAAVLGSP
jgi:hypothetical protein